MEEAIKDTERFSEWMKNVVQSVHYANTNRMIIAYDKVLQNNLRLTIKSK
jgi:hypothetical protein